MFQFPDLFTLSKHYTKKFFSLQDNDVYSYETQYAEPYQYETQNYSQYQPSYNADYFKNYQNRVR